MLKYRERTDTCIKYNYLINRINIMMISRK